MIPREPVTVLAESRIVAVKDGLPFRAQLCKKEIWIKRAEGEKDSNELVNVVDDYKVGRWRAPASEHREIGGRLRAGYRDSKEHAFFCDDVGIADGLKPVELLDAAVKAGEVGGGVFLFVRLPEASEVVPEHC